MTTLKTIGLLLLLSPALPAQHGPFLVVFLSSNTNKPELPKHEVDSLMAGHLANIEKLAREGKILAAGPFYGGGGIFVMSTASRDTAWEWLRTDPGVRANRWVIELLPYTPRVGSICSVGEDYEMVGYGFVRYTPTQRSSIGNRILDAHLEYIKAVIHEDSLVAEGIFGDGEGAIVVMRGEPDEVVLKNEPHVRNRNFDISIRKLWIARGAFCEK